jgi:integrase
MRTVPTSVVTRTGQGDKPAASRRPQTEDETMTTIPFRTSTDVQPQTAPLACPVAQTPAAASPTLADLFRQYQAEYLSDKARTTRYQHALFFAQVLRDLGPVPLEALTPDLLRAWKMRLSASCKPGTVYRYLRRLNAPLVIAVEDYCWLAANPLKRVKKPSPGRGRVRFLTAEERPRLLAACQAVRSPQLYPMVLLALATGGRKNEIRQLQWSEVDLQAGVVRFLRTKNQESRAVPVAGEARAVLASLAAQRRPEVRYVFPCRHGGKAIVVERAWRAALRQAEIQDFRWHDLRHTFASWMAMSGASLRDIAEVLGHRNIQQTMVYAHLLQSHTASVVERMARQFLSTRPRQEGGPHV